MNIENFSTTNLPGLADLGDDPGPVGCSATGVGSGNLTSTTSNLYILSTGIYTNNITVNSSNPYTYGLSRLIKSYIDSELDVIYTYLTINGFNVYATILGPSGELFVEKAPIKGKEDLIHRSRKK